MLLLHLKLTYNKKIKKQRKNKENIQKSDTNFNRVKHGFTEKIM